MERLLETDQSPSWLIALPPGAVRDRGAWPPLLQLIRGQGPREMEALKSERRSCWRQARKKPITEA
jgi:hypothetical protein